MGKYLKIVEARYRLEDFIDTSDPEVDGCIKEAATCYAFHLETAKISFDGISKVVLVGGSEEERGEKLLDVLTWQHPYHVINQLSSHKNLYEIKSSYVREVSDALVRVAERNTWDIAPVSSLYDEVLAKQFKFEGVWMKNKANPSRSDSIGIRWNTDNNRIKIRFAYESKGGGAEQSIPIVSIPIGLGQFETILGRFEWRGNQSCRLWNKNKRDYWELDLQNRETQFHYGPAEEGNPHGQFALAKMYLDGNHLVEVDERKALELLKRSSEQGFGPAKKLLAALQTVPRT